MTNAIITKSQPKLWPFPLGLPPMDDNDCEEFMCTRLWWWCERLHSFAHGLKQPEAGTILSAVLRMHLIQPRKPAGVKVCIRKTKIIVPIASSGCHLFRHQSERLALLSGFPKARSVCKMPLFLKCCQKRHTHMQANTDGLDRISSALGKMGNSCAGARLGSENENVSFFVGKLMLSRLPSKVEVSTQIRPNQPTEPAIEQECNYHKHTSLRSIICTGT